jgi:hypothetical protein
MIHKEGKVTEGVDMEEGVTGGGDTQKGDLEGG